MKASMSSKSKSPTTQSQGDEVVRRQFGKCDVNKVHGINNRGAYCAFKAALA